MPFAIRWTFVYRWEHIIATIWFNIRRYTYSASERAGGVDARSPSTDPLTKYNLFKYHTQSTHTLPSSAYVLDTTPKSSFAVDISKVAFHCLPYNQPVPCKLLPFYSITFVSMAPCLRLHVCYVCVDVG